MKKLKLRKAECSGDNYEWFVGKGCFEKTKKATSAPAAQIQKPSTPTQKKDERTSVGKKLKLRKAECSGDNYEWFVGKGCFEKTPAAQTQKDAPPVQTKKASPPPASAPVVQTKNAPEQKDENKLVKCKNYTFIDQNLGENDTNSEKFIEKLNCLELPLRQVNFILGPCVFYDFRLGNRNFYLFGERHDQLARDYQELKNEGATPENTLTFQGFVHSLVSQNPDKTYDLMLENSYFPIKNTFIDTRFEKRRISSPTLTQLTYHFDNCIVKDRRKHCGYKNLRVHYVDYRRLIYGNLGDENAVVPKNFSADESLQKVKELMKTEKILKQINAIKDEKIKNAFVKFFTDVVNHVEMGGASLAIMDVYAMGRILRDFDSKKENGNGFQGTSENVIYYAGRDHIKTLVIFFINYLKLYPRKLYGQHVNHLECKSFVHLPKPFV